MAAGTGRYFPDLVKMQFFTASITDQCPKTHYFPGMVVIGFVNMVFHPRQFDAGLVNQFQQ